MKPPRRSREEMPCPSCASSTLPATMLEPELAVHAVTRAGWGDRGPESLTDATEITGPP